MSTPTAPPVTSSARPWPRSAKAVAFLAVALLLAAPHLAAVLAAVVVWALTQPWLLLPALLVAVAWHWRPHHTRRALQVGAVLAAGWVAQRRQPKTA